MGTNQSCRIYLQPDYAETFFNNALHPNYDYLSSRDEFIARESEVHPYWMEGDRVVTEIPDIDWDALEGIKANECEEYLEFKVSEVGLNTPDFETEFPQFHPYKTVVQLNQAA